MRTALLTGLAAFAPGATCATALTGTGSEASVVTPVATSAPADDARHPDVTTSGGPAGATRAVSSPSESRRAAPASAVTGRTVPRASRSATSTASSSSPTPRPTSTATAGRTPRRSSTSGR